MKIIKVIMAIIGLNESISPDQRSPQREPIPTKILFFEIIFEYSDGSELSRI